MFCTLTILVGSLFLLYLGFLNYLLQNTSNYIEYILIFFVKQYFAAFFLVT